MFKKILLTTIVCSVVFQSLVAEVEVGEKVKSLPSVKTTAGVEFDWTKYQGKLLVLEWLNPDCPFVKRHYREKTVHGVVEQLDAKKVAWVGVNSTHYMSTEATKLWQDQQNISWPVVMDPDGALGRFFGAKTTPHIFVIDADSRLIYKGAIDDDPYGQHLRSKRVMHLAFLFNLDSQKQLVPTWNKSYGCSVKYG